jgi:hypothetical protein
MSEQMENSRTAEPPVSGKYDFIPIPDSDMLGGLFRMKDAGNSGENFSLKKAIKRWIRRKN